MIGSSVSHYRILEKLGAGGMGEVYAAEDTHLARRVAIKFPSLTDDGGDRRSRFLIEARAASRLDHPNIARVYDYGEAPDGRPFLVMELVAGTTLRHVLKDGPLAPATAIAIVGGVLRALREAHRNGLIHRDIKPANIMLTATGDVKVLDFGLAKEMLETASGILSQAATAPMGPTRAGVIPGTPEYMSPEQARGNRLDGRSDLFSAGLVLYECLTARQAFSGANGPEVLAKVVHADPPAPSSLAPGVPAALDRIVRRALAKDPAQRYQTADEMLTDLAAASAAPGQTASRTARSMVAGLIGSRRRLVWLSVLGLILASAAGWLMWRTRPHEPLPEAMAWYQRGTVALRDGTYYTAARNLEQAVKVDPDFALAHARLAEARNELDDSEGANREMLAALPTRSGRASSGIAGLYVDAIHQTLKRDFAGAIRSYTELLGKVTATEKAAVLVDLGRVHEKNADTTKALEAYREAARRDPQNASAHLRAAELLGMRQLKLTEASAEFTSADALYQALSNTEGQVEVLFQRGLLASTVPKFLPEARAALEKAIQLARAISTEQQEVAAALQLSVVAYQQGDAANAEQIAEAAVEKARRAGMLNLAARGLTDLGNAQYSRNDFARAEATIQNAIDLAHRFGLRRNEARARLSLASIRQQQGVAVAEVLSDATHALGFYQPAGFLQLTMSCLTVIARANRALGNYTDAAKGFQQVVSLSEVAGDRQSAGNAEQGVASVLYEQGRWPDALSHFRKYYEIARANSNRSGIGLGLVNQAKVLRQLGRYPEAVELLGQVQVLVQERGQSPALPTLIANARAEIALGRGNYREAVAKAREMLSLPSTSQHDAAGAQCTEGLALALSGSAREGKRLCSKGVSAAEALGDVSTLSELRLMFAEVLVANREIPPAQEQLRLARDAFERTGRTESAWRACAVAARAYRLARDQAAAKQAAQQGLAHLAELRAAWSAADLESYLKIPYIRGLDAELR